MGLGNVPHNTLHLLPLIRAQKERSRQRDVQFIAHRRLVVPRPRLRTTSNSTCMHGDDARLPLCRFRNTHRALDDASKRSSSRTAAAAQFDGHVDVCGPLTIDVWRCARATLVLGWVVWRDGGGQVRGERGELAFSPLLLLLFLLLFCTWWWGLRRGGGGEGGGVWSFVGA
jgi:hypothetical protein